MMKNETTKEKKKMKTMIVTRFYDNGKITAKIETQEDILPVIKFLHTLKCDIYKREVKGEDADRELLKELDEIAIA